MMKTISNTEDVPLVLAVWLVHDEYDYIDHPNYISATGLMKPLRHILLPSRLHPIERKQEDVADYISRGLGHSIHDSIEKAWTLGYQRNLAKLGYPQSVIDRIRINPTDAQLDHMKANEIDPIPVYLEQRMYRQHKGKIIGGKYDNITDGIVNDTKSTSAYSWVFGGRTSDYQIQGSIYRWLDAQGFEDIDLTQSFRPRITEDYMRVNFVFTDWQKMQAKTNRGYPQKRVEQKEIPLLTLEDTEMWINEKLRLIEKFKDVPEKDLPECTPEELWQSDPVYKYYADPIKAQAPGAKSTKNFDDLNDARKFQAEKGGKGMIKTVPGSPKRCEYCPAFDACTQKDKYFP
jgi:hypothetical protein